MSRSSIWIGLAVLLLLVLPVIAKPEHLVLGPYTVTFDAGKELQDWNITKKESESISGSAENTYTADSAKVTIQVDYMEGKVLRNIEESRKDLEERYKAEGKAITAYPRVIDGRDGFVADLSSPNKPLYSAAWLLNNETSAAVVSLFPWDDGTLQLLKTINITFTE